MTPVPKTAQFNSFLSDAIFAISLSCLSCTSVHFFKCNFAVSLYPFVRGMATCFCKRNYRLRQVAPATSATPSQRNPCGTFFQKIFPGCWSQPGNTVFLLFYCPFTEAISFPPCSSMRMTSPSRTFPSRINLAASVSTCLVRKRFSGRAP